MSHGGVSVGAVSQSGVRVRTMSHKCERYESEWSKCGKEKKRVCVSWWSKCGKEKKRVHVSCKS